MRAAGGRGQPVTELEVCWSARGCDDTFTFLVVTADQARHTIEVRPAAAAALMTLARANVRLLWDPESRTLTAGNLLNYPVNRTGPVSGGNVDDWLTNRSSLASASSMSNSPTLS